MFYGLIVAKRTKCYFQVRLKEHGSEFCFCDSQGFVPVQNFALCHEKSDELHEAILVSTVIYTDDTITFSKTWEYHVREGRALFEALKGACLVVNLPKCEFGKGTVNKLSHQVGCEMVLTRATKVQTMVDILGHHTTDVGITVGMCWCYYFFCRKYCSNRRPFDTLVEEGCQMEVVRCQEASIKVMTILCAPVLRDPAFQKPFRLAVAYDVGVGAALS